MDFRWGTMMSLRTVMKPHMKNSVVTIVNAREFDFVPVAGTSVSVLANIRFLTATPDSDAIQGEERDSSSIRAAKPQCVSQFALNQRLWASIFRRAGCGPDTYLGRREACVTVSKWTSSAIIHRKLMT